MRIIAGEFKGRTLTSVPEDGVRPATDRVRSTIFNMLQNRLNLHNADILDVFAGSGSLGFEALSRGARHTVFIDLGPQVIRMLDRNAELLRCEDRCLVLQDDASRYLQTCQMQFDLIFVDPPYAYEQTAELIGVIFQRKLLKQEGYVIVEHSAKTVIASTDYFRLAVQKEFGHTRVSFLQYQEEHV